MVECITIWQPWASLVMGGIEAERIVIDDAMRLGLSLEGAIVKDTENRAWPTSHRGTVVIHAARRNYRPGVQQVAPGLRIDIPPGLPKGMCLGTVQLVACDRGRTGIWAEAGHFHWHLEEPVAFPEPVPWRGRERLFEVPWPYEHLVEESARRYGVAGKQGRLPLPCLTPQPPLPASAANGAAAKEGENGDPAVAGPPRVRGVAAVGQDARPTRDTACIGTGSRLPTYGDE
jgi:hypothetical protein